MSLPAQQGLIALPLSAVYGTDRVFLVKDGRLESASITIAGYQYALGQRDKVLVFAPGIEDGDQVIMDFAAEGDEGRVPEEGFTRMSVIIGGSGFEELEKLVTGLEAGNEKKKKLSFPEGFREHTLAGKKAKAELKMRLGNQTGKMLRLRSIAGADHIHSGLCCRNGFLFPGNLHKGDLSHAFQCEQILDGEFRHGVCLCDEVS